MSKQAIDASAFDSYAAEYDAALQQGISVSGEGKDFFARGRIAWLAKILGALDFHPKARVALAKRERHADNVGV